MRAFIRSVVVGALVAATPFLFFTTYLAFGFVDHGSHPLEAIGIALFPLALTLPIVLVAALLIGLPLTALLRRAGRERGAAYLLSGGVAGGLLPILFASVIGEPTGFWLGLPGAIAGAATGWTWWRHGREPALLALPVT